MSDIIKKMKMMSDAMMVADIILPAMDDIKLQKAEEGDVIYFIASMKKTTYQGLMNKLPQIQKMIDEATR